MFRYIAVIFSIFFASHAWALTCPNLNTLNVSQAMGFPYGYSDALENVKYISAVGKPEGKNGQWIVVGYPIYAKGNTLWQTEFETLLKMTSPVSETPFNAQLRTVDTHTSDLTFCVYTVKNGYTTRYNRPNVMAYWIDNYGEDDADLDSHAVSRDIFKILAYMPHN